MRARSAACLLFLLLFGLAACGAGIELPSGTTTSRPSVEGRVAGTVLAGPVCPVETTPPDPACADRPVAGAVIVVTLPDGTPVARATSDARGRFSLALPVGTYRFTPQPVPGLLGTAGAVEVEVAAEEAAVVTFTYDTGIRGPAGG